MNKDSKIYIAGHGGMVGTALVRALQDQGFHNLILRTREELNLLEQSQVRDFFNTEKPEYVFLAAAKVGGMKAFMDSPADFLFENAQIQNNVIWSAHQSGVKKLLFLSTSSVFPANCPQPMKEEYLLDGKVDPTTESYAVAKITGMELCRMISRQYNQNFVSCTPTNIYGENDSFDPKNSRVIASLIKKFHEAKTANASEIVMWGTGEARREFLHVNDLAQACVFLMQRFDYTEDAYFINVGSGQDIAMKELAELVNRAVGYEGVMRWDTTKPDGMPKKLLDTTKINTLGWKSEIKLADGVAALYQWYKNQLN